MLARVVAAPCFHQIFGAALPLFSAAFVGLPGLPPLPPLAVALFAAVRHATGLHCGQSSRARSTVAPIPVSCSSSSLITSERRPRVLDLLYEMLHTSPGRAKEHENGWRKEARPTIVQEGVGARLAPDRERDQVLHLMRIALIGVTIVVGLTMLALLGVVLWKVLSIYIDPQTATERRYLVLSFVIVLAGGTWLLVGASVVGVLYVSRRNLQQQRELEGQRAHEIALAAYLDQMVRLLNDRDRPLRRSERGDEVSILAKGRTHTVLPKVDSDRKARVLQFLYETGLIVKGHSVVDLLGADLRAANLRGANLRGADLRGADLSRANLGGADLKGADFYGANLREVNLHWADLISANLSRAYLGRADLSLADLTGADLRNVMELTVGQLDQAYSLEGATIPDGSKHP